MDMEMVNIALPTLLLCLTVCATVELQLCCTLYYLWFLHIVEVGGLFMPTNECNKGGELLATGQL